MQEHNEHQPEAGLTLPANHTPAAAIATIASTIIAFAIRRFCFFFKMLPPCAKKAPSHRKNAAFYYGKGNAFPAFSPETDPSSDLNSIICIYALSIHSP